MLMQECTPEMVENWKAVYDEYRLRLCPNRKTAAEVIEYLKGKYPLTEELDDKWKQVVVSNVLLNECHAKKLPAGKSPRAIVFSIQDTGTRKLLYENQDDIFKGQKIFVGVELETAFFHVEGSSMLWDELFAFRGLDQDDLKNFYLVAEYITCLKRFNMLDSVLNETGNGGRT